MKKFGKLVIILISLLITEVISKSFNSDRLKLLLQNEKYCNGHRIYQPISVENFSNHLKMEKNENKYLKHKILDNFDLSNNYRKLENLNGKLMEKNQNDLDQIIYPDKMKQLLSMLKNRGYLRDNTLFNKDNKLDIIKYSGRGNNLYQKYKNNLIWPIERNRIIDKRISHQTKPKFTPSISIAALTNLGKYFNDLKDNVNYIETIGFTEQQRQLLDGDLPIKSLRRELDSHNLKLIPSQNDDFLHAVRNYRPSQRIRALVEMTPRGYHGTNFIDPNYMWLGLGK